MSTQFDALLQQALQLPEEERELLASHLIGSLLPLTNPLLGKPIRGGKRAFRLSHFPYNMIYKVIGSELNIVAVAHHSRRPGYWAGRK